MFDNMSSGKGAFIPFLDGALTAERRLLQLGEQLGKHAIPGIERHKSIWPGCCVCIITVNDAKIGLSPDPDKT